MDILIYAKPEKVEHKIENRIPKEINYCYWRVSVLPKIRDKVINKVYFSDGSIIFAEGDYIGNDCEAVTKKKEICFKPLKRVNKKQPKKPPTRGWCYINKEKYNGFNS